MSIQSLDAVGMTFPEVYDQSQLMERYITITKGRTIKVCDITIGLVGVIIALSSEVLVLKVSTLHVNYFNIRVSLGRPIKVAH